MEVEQDKALDNYGIDVSHIFRIEQAPLKTKILSEPTTPIKHYIPDPENDSIDAADKIAENYPKEQQKHIRNILTCGKKDILAECEDCGTMYRSRFLCGLRYCKHPDCVEFRKHQAYYRMSGLEKFRKLHHFTAGSLYLSKKELEQALGKFINIMRKNYKQKTHKLYNKPAYKMEYLKVFDISNKNYSKTKKLWFHFHFAMKLEFSHQKIREFIRYAAIAVKMAHNKVEFNNIGFKNTHSILNYFSKRVAGQYGHKGNYYYLPDLMNLDTFFKIYHHTKCLTYSLPAGLINMYSTSSSNMIKNCKECGGKTKFHGYESLYARVKDG